MVERSRYLKEVFGSVKTGWHAQIFQTYEGLLRKGVMLPQIDVKSSDQLLRGRSKFHYDILGQTSMRGAYGVKNYFKFLPIVVTSVDLAIKSLQQIIKPLPNGSDSRFKELVNKIPILLKAYKIK